MTAILIIMELTVGWSEDHLDCDGNWLYDVATVTTLAVMGIGCRME